MATLSKNLHPNTGDPAPTATRTQRHLGPNAWVALLVAGLPWPAPGQQPAPSPALHAWEIATQERLARFFPDPAASGFTDHVPWEPPLPPGTKAWSTTTPGNCGGAFLGDCPVYWVVDIARNYFVADTALARQVTALTQQIQPMQQNLVQRMTNGPPLTPAEIAKVNGMGKTLDSLKREAKSIALSIRANVTPQTQGLTEPPAGMLKGHPLYRRTYPVGPDMVELAVFLGPQGMTIGKSPDGTEATVPLVVKSLYVATVTPARQATGAQRLLEAVDYSGLAALLQP